MAAYTATPVGQAEIALGRGDQFFQLEIEISKIAGFGTYSAFETSGNKVESTCAKTDMLGQIRRRSAGISIMSGTSSSADWRDDVRNRLGGTGQGVVICGTVLGIYLFRPIGGERR